MAQLIVTIHRSAHEIGGNCIEIATDGGHRLLLDAGRPLDTPESEPTPIPASLDLTKPVDALLLSHAHQDHYGMLGTLPNEIPVWCGAASGRLIRLLGDVLNRPLPQTLQHWDGQHQFNVGPFRILPILADHSAFDAHMFLIEVHGKRLFYTGDFRGHGRKAKLTERLLDNPPREVDVLLMEGTNLGANKSMVSEFGLEEEFVTCFKDTPGRVFVSWSAMNVDRTVSLYRACLRTGRTLVVDLYTSEVLSQLGRDSIPKPGSRWPSLKVVVTNALNRRYQMMGKGHIVPELKEQGRAMGAAALEQNPSRWVIISRGSLVRDYVGKNVLPTPEDCWVWSQWGGYLKEKDGLAQAEYYAPCRKVIIHTSGHASPELLQELAHRMAPRHLVPIHGESWDRCRDSFEKITRLSDGESLNLEE